MATTQRQSIRLCQAAYDNDVEGVVSEIALGTNVNTRDENGWTPLINAAFAEAVETVEVLIKHPDVDVNAFGDDGVTALMNACLVGNVRIVELLLGASGIDVNARDNSGLTALDHANPEREDFGELRSRMEDIRKLITTASTHTQIKNGAQIVLESAKKMAKRLSGRLSLSRAEKKKDSEKTIESKKPNEAEEKPKKKVQKNKMRCFECRKKIGLAGIDCNCGFVFCGEHSYPANHNCDYDFKAEARARYMHNHAGKGAVVEKIVGEKL